MWYLKLLKKTVWLLIFAIWFLFAQRLTVICSKSLDQEVWWGLYHVPYSCQGSSLTPAASETGQWCSPSWARTEATQNKKPSGSSDLRKPINCTSTCVDIAVWLEYQYVLVLLKCNHPSKGMLFFAGLLSASPNCNSHSWTHRLWLAPQIKNIFQNLIWFGPLIFSAVIQLLDFTCQMPVSQAALSGEPDPWGLAFTSMPACFCFNSLAVVLNGNCRNSAIF